MLNLGSTMVALISLGHRAGRDSRQDNQMNKLATSYSLWFAILITPLTAHAESLDYDCSVGALKLLIHVDTAMQSVRQSVTLGSTTESANYSDGVFGAVSHAGEAASIPSIPICTNNRGLHRLRRGDEGNRGQGGDRSAFGDDSPTKRQQRMVFFAF
jgi:hypothetical protein